MRFSGALSKKLNSKFKYLDLIKDNSDNEQLHSFKQIEKDLDILKNSKVNYVFIPDDCEIFPDDFSVKIF